MGLETERERARERESELQKMMWLGLALKTMSFKMHVKNIKEGSIPV